MKSDMHLPQYLFCVYEELVEFTPNNPNISGKTVCE